MTRNSGEVHALPLFFFFIEKDKKHYRFFLIRRFGKQLFSLLFYFAFCPAHFSRFALLHQGQVG